MKHDRQNRAQGRGYCKLASALWAAWNKVKLLYERQTPSDLGVDMDNPPTISESHAAMLPPPSAVFAIFDPAWCACP